jgi:hypothetical protein
MIETNIKHEPFLKIDSKASVSNLFLDSKATGSITSLASQFSTSEMEYNSLSEQTTLMRNINELNIPSTLTSIQEKNNSTNNPLIIEESLFDACANVKIITSQISMHLAPGWREKLFLQIDRMHDKDEWDEEDLPVNTSSFQAFIGWMLQIEFTKGPGLGLTTTGNLIAAWTYKGSRLTLEFLPKFHVRWVVTKQIDDQVERASGTTSINRLSENLAPYSPENLYSPKV